MDPRSFQVGGFGMNEVRFLPQSPARALLVYWDNSPPLAQAPFAPACPESWRQEGDSEGIPSSCKGTRILIQTVVRPMAGLSVVPE